MRKYVDELRSYMYYKYIYWIGINRPNYYRCFNKVVLDLLHKKYIVTKLALNEIINIEGEIRMQNMKKR